MDHWKRGAKVFIGPEVNCRTEATMASSQNLPLISHKCKDQTVSDKKRFFVIQIGVAYRNKKFFHLKFFF
jgi:hypothetical protein